MTGGAETQARHLIESLSNRENLDVIFICRWPGKAPPSDSCRIVEIGKIGFLHRYGFWWDSWSLWRTLKKESPDIIYQRVGCAYSGLCALYANKKGKRMIWQLASEMDCLKPGITPKALLKPHKIIESFFVSMAAKQAPIIIAQTYDQADLLYRSYGRRPDHVIRNFHPVPEKPVKHYETLEIVWIANLKDIKRPELFLDLTEMMLTVPNIRFTMIGAQYADHQREKQEYINKRLSRLPNTDYLGELPQDKVNAILSRAHVLVNTSISEGFSNTFIQAWMREVPVYSLGVNPDNMLNDGLGKCCQSLEELASSLKQLATVDTSVISQAGMQARNTAISSFSMKNAEELIDILLDVNTEKITPRNQLSTDGK
jgi:glycosyltransferase involved in cell wall biosynthesis